MGSDIDFTNCAVPIEARRSTTTMLMIMVGFTFFSASMWAGQKLADGNDLTGFLSALILGGGILAFYTGSLGYIGAKTGMGLDILARKALGEKGSYLVSLIVTITQIGWFGVGIAMFALPVAEELFGSSETAKIALIALAGISMTSSAYFGIKSLTIISYIAVPAVAILGGIATYTAISSGELSLTEQFLRRNDSMSLITGTGLVVGSFIAGGTSTPNFTRYAKSGKSGFFVTIIAFFLGNSLMFLFGGVASAYVGGNDIFQVMIRLNMFYFAILVLGLNIWTTNDNALYSAGLGLANVFKKEKKKLILISGCIGTLTSTWLYWNFCDWLTLLNSFLPPCGIILILSYFINKKEYATTDVHQSVNWFSIAGIIFGAIAAILYKQGLPSINSMIIAAIIYLLGSLISRTPSNRLQLKQGTNPSAI